MTTKPVPIPNHKLGQAMQHMVECGKRPCFRIDGIRITIASSTSTNPGYLYIKNNDWDYIGKITPQGLMKIQFPSEITSTQKQLVLDAIHDPESTAMSNGKVTGTCCCCGRTLTNKLSIELGIGPICRGFWFPGHTSEANTIVEAPIETTTVREMLESLEARDSLELDLGAPYESKNSVEQVSKTEPVHRLLADYQYLNDTQQRLFRNLIGVVRNGNN